MDNLGYKSYVKGMILKPASSRKTKPNQYIGSIRHGLEKNFDERSEPKGKYSGITKTYMASSLDNNSNVILKAFGRRISQKPGKILRYAQNDNRMERA